MEGESLVEKWISKANSKVSQVAINFEKCFLRQETDIYFTNEYQNWHSKFSASVENTDNTFDDENYQEDLPECTEDNGGTLDFYI
jgi:hypothetical protein